jgi:hypothetical protein
MNEVKLALAEDVQEQVAEVAYRARYSELLTPRQWSEHAAQVHKSCRERGYVIRSELSYDDVLRLTRAGRSNNMRIGTLTQATSSPMVLIAAQAEGIEYRWAVPLSTHDGAAWLREGLERRRFLIAVESTSMPVVGVLYLCAEASDNLQRLAEPLEGPPASGTPSSEELMEAAVWLTTAERLPFDKRLPKPKDVRAMLTTAGPFAVELMNFFAGCALRSDALRDEGGRPVQN